MADWVADYRETIATRRITPTVQPGEVTSGLSTTMPVNSESLADVLRDLDDVIMPGIVHWGHPSFLGYFGSTSNGPALLGEIAAAALNVSAMTWRTSPAATELETIVLRWVRELVGLPESFTGVVYDTASVAVVHALAVAREAALSKVRERGLAGRTDLPTTRIYASTQAHSSLQRAMIMLGLGEANLVHVDTDSAFRMDVTMLRRAIDDDVRRGYLPLAVVATVGTTTSASVDPVPEIAAECAARGIWLHVDAAYGGATGVLPEKRHLLDGLEHADSVIVNPHKWLFVPLDFSTLYLRRPELLRALFTLVPEYLRGDTSSQQATGEGAAIDYMDYGIQLGRRFRALKAWMVFRAFGRTGIEARLREHCRLAQLLATWIDDEPQFGLSAPVVMGVVCFRFAPAGMDDRISDALNEAIVSAANASGDVYLTHSRLAGRTVMRVGIGNILTTETHLRGVWARVLAESERLHSGPNADRRVP
jgi:aromatic-L-amino-acid decarboxylase